jgi:NADH-quinone oxidoreductase subunit L
LLALAPVVPALTLAAYLLHVFAGARAGWRTALFGIVAMGMGSLLSIGMLVQLVSGAAPYHAAVPWLDLAGIHVMMGVTVGPLEALMLTMVTSVSCLIEIYSIGYMHGDPRYNRFFCNVTLFVTGMLTAVIADNFILFFAAWEIMGLCSYLLIGHWFEDPANCRAANKAFLVTRLGDVGLLLGIWWAFSLTGTFNFAALSAALQHAGASGAALDGIALLIFLGAVGKSAQIPLQIWLPDAMAGPTPISALIHAATMVAAGVFLVARNHALFALAPHALFVVALVGALSAFVPATIACVQTDIKKTLAYSTISQLGYMMLGMGLGSAAAYTAGLFHLLAHAFFKALLFLGSGSVIHAAGTQDMHEMGGLWRKQRTTAITFIVGALALSAIWPFSGFFSKDAILSAAYASPYKVFWLLGVLAAFLTAYYMTRCVWLTFFGEPRDAHVYEHAHESPAVMTVPLWILAVPAALLGFAGGAIRGWLAPAVCGGQASAAGCAAPDVGMWEYLPLVLALAGILVGYLVYAAPLAFRVRLLRSPAVRAPWVLFKQLWYFDHLGEAVKYGLGLGPSFVVAAFDRYVVDGMVGLVAALFMWLGRMWRSLSTGNAQAYMLTLAVATALGLIALQWMGGGRLG